ncbi:hypothetical protein Scep_030114 [Stephania cephalantha]|uniref:Uncharacterized protein n=1 Tax=Stephania cephalantha TaxID=152367 RepID=A0AAP0E297_9MAGN
MVADRWAASSAASDGRPAVPAADRAAAAAGERVGQRRESRGGDERGSGVMTAAAAMATSARQRCLLGSGVGTVARVVGPIALDVDAIRRSSTTR